MTAVDSQLTPKEYTLFCNLIFTVLKEYRENITYMTKKQEDSQA